MATRSRLYARSRPRSTNQSESRIKRANLIILSNNANEFVINDDRIGVKAFTEENVDSWFDYITTESNMTNVYLFVPNIFTNVMLESICEYPQIEYVYIFGKDPRYPIFSDLHGKLKGTFDESNHMLEEFRADIDEKLNQFYFEQSTFQNINEGSSEVLWWTFFNRVLQYITYTNVAMKQLIQSLIVNYQSDDRALREIKEFEENYHRHSAIRWYTTNTFLFRTLNGTLRTSNNFDDIFKLQFIIKDMASELRRIQMTSSGLASGPSIVYRGQSMSYAAIIQLQSNIGQLFFSKQFLSTSLDKDVALMFADAAEFAQSVLVFIRLELNDYQRTVVPFADISKLSRFDKEKEVLFSPCSTFQIESVEFQERNRWHVHLKYVDSMWSIDFGERSIFSPHADQIYSRNLSNENKQFIAFQLLLDMILRLGHNNYAKEELLEFSRSKYKDSPTELNQINDFERNYCSENAAIWYTKDSFLYRLLNESLRMEKIDSIVKMRYYIYDLHNELVQLQLQQFNNQTNLILYRGQLMKIDYLNELRENYDGHISFNSFTAATEDRAVAFMFSGDGTTTSPDEVSVIFEMSIDTNIRSTPFARIRSTKPDEQEILFSMGGVFRIGEINDVPSHPGVHCIKLKLEHLEDELWNKLTKHLHQFH